MKFARYALGAVLLFPALALAVPVTAIITWPAPTLTESGLPLVSPNNLTGYRVMVSTSPIADDSTMPATQLVAPNLTTWTYTGDHPAGTTLYVRVKAVNSTGASAFSPQGSKTITIPPSLPNAPGTPQVVVTITVS